MEAARFSMLCEHRLERCLDEKLLFCVSFFILVIADVKKGMHEEEDEDAAMWQDDWDDDDVDEDFTKQLRAELERHR